jgi:hypothetical protein
MFSRIVTFHPKSGEAAEEIRVTVHDPERDPRGPDYRVLVRLEAAGSHKEDHVHGVDGMQCLIEALFLLPTLLKGFPGPGHHTWHGRQDLGLVRPSKKGTHR